MKQMTIDYKFLMFELFLFYFIAEWRRQNVERTKDGRKLGVGMLSPQFDALDKSLHVVS